MKHLNKRLFKALIPYGLFLVLLLVGGTAQAVTITIGSASGQVGDVVALPVTVTGLTESIWSYELEFTWSASYAQCVGINTAGTLSDSWSTSPAIGAGNITVAGASAMPLSGDGLLFELMMDLGPGSGTRTIYFGQTMLNEGDPVPVLANGSLIISALPTIDITPDTGLMAVGDSLAFTSYSGTIPYTYTSSDPLVADFTGNWLHALAPGYVQATSEDANGITSTTTGQIEVRAFRLTVESTIVTAGQMALVPVTLDDPTGFGIVAGEVEVSWYAPYATFAGLEMAGTTIAAAGWATPLVSESSGRVNVVMAGTSPLSSAGVLFYLKLVPVANIYLSIGSQVFNETYPALPVSNYLTTTALPAIGLSPTSAILRVGDQVQFTVNGSPTPPYVWSTDDPAIATIDASGLMTAVGEGSVQIQVVDSLGAVAKTTSVTVCALGLPPLISSISANETVLVPITVDRNLDPLDIYSYELSVNYSPSSVAFVGAVVAGALTNGWGTPMVVDDGNSVNIFHAGAMPLTGCGPALVYLEFQGLPTLVTPYTGVSLASNALFNEGTPCVRVNTGTVCETISAVPRAETGLELWPNHPNPFNPSTTIRYSLASDGVVELAVYSARGARVRTLVTGWQVAGSLKSVVWDGRDDDGRNQPSGVYYARLQSQGNSALQKMVLLK